MHELEFKGASYRVGDLTPMQEFHCVRRVAPILAALGVGAAELKAVAGATPEELLGTIGKPVLDVLAHMSNEDVEYVFDTCLGVVQRKVADGRWGPVTVGGRMQYQDVDMPTMVRLCVEVLKGRVGDFFGQPTEGTGTS